MHFAFNQYEIYWNNYIFFILVKSTRTHFYYTMKNSEGTEEGLRDDLLKVIDHNQVKQAFLKLCYEYVQISAGTCAKIYISPVLLGVCLFI